MGRKSKKQIIIDEALKHKDFERKRIEEIMKALGKYTPALHPLIEVYLDACEVYYIKYFEWKEIGFKSTKIHTNKNGAKNEIKHPLAQQVEVWSDKKTKLLNALGLDMKGKMLEAIDPLFSENEKNRQQESEVPDGRLLQFKKIVGDNK